MRFSSFIMMVIISLVMSAEGLYLNHLNTINHLSNNKINSIFRDSDGFLWIGTSSGLYRYDGYTFKNYEPESAENKDTFDNSIEGIQEDSEGRLWIFSGSKYSVYDPSTDIMTTEISGILGTSGITGTPALLYIDSTKSIWLHIQGQGLYRVSPDFRNAEMVKDDNLKTVQLTDIESTPDGIVTLDNNGVLKIIDPVDLKVVRSDSFIADELGKGNTYVFTFVYDRDRLGWIFSNERLWLYDMTDGKWLNDMLPPMDHRRFVKILEQDRSGNLWIGRDHQGLEQIVKSNDGISFKKITSEPSQEDINTVTSIYEDNSGIVWIGTYKKGLYYHHQSTRKFNLYPFNDVNCILPSSDGQNVWVGTDAAGLIRWNPATGQRNTIKVGNGQLQEAVTSLLEFPDGTLYIGSFNRSLKRYRNGKIETIVTNSALDNSYCWALAKGDGDKIIVGTLGAGIFVFDPSTLKVNGYNSKNSGLCSDYVVSIEKDNKDTYYIGTSLGVTLFKASSGEFSSIKPLDGVNISDMSIDSRGLVWIATSRGLKVYDPQRDRLVTVKLDRRNSNSTLILGIQEDKNGNVWVAEGGNLISFSVKFDDKNGDFSYTFHRYDASDGLPECDFNQRSFAMLPSGEMLVGGLYGINGYYPDKIPHNRNLPNVMFSDIYAGAKDVRIGEKIKGHVLLESSPNHGGQLDLWPEHSSFTVYFATDSYVHPEKTTFYYMLEGLDKEWLATPPGSNHAGFTNLAPGNYRLLVKAVNSDGYESAKTAEMAIVVHPPFWLTGWAKAIYIALGILCIYLTYRVIRQRERRRFNEKRKQDAMQKQEEINQLKFKFYTNVSHELRTPLTLIVSPLENMIKETTDEVQRRRLNLMRNNAMRLLNLVNQLLDFRKNEVAGLTLHLSEGEIVGFVRNVCHAFAGVSERKNISLKFNSDRQELNMMFDEDKLNKAIMNLLSNAFKFTPEGGTVTVSLTTHSSAIAIRVSDTGTGISDDDKEHIFERFFQTNITPADSSMTGNGIGLSMVSEYVKLHEGSISVCDNPGGGSIFTIELPIIKPQTASNVVPAIAETVSSPEEITDTDSNIEETPVESPTTFIDSTEKPTALIVDDSHDMIEFLRDGLSSEFHVITSNDGESALKLLSSIRPAIILTDLMMPGVDGMELCRRIKADSSLNSIPVIILTAKHDMDSKFEGLTIGADDYITKPFNTDLLLIKMKKLVNLTRKNGQSLINPEPDTIKITPLDEKMVEKAVKYVVTNIKRTDLSVEELSAHLGMSRVHLYKKLKATTGKTPIEFIRLIRLKRGAQMLRESQLNVSEIAFQLGYNNPKYFSKYFKEEFGVLPSVYQNQESKATNYSV
ncbi:hybrid sensor histidine kinase/response regulator transcription factor [uncultured Duncaniella sp.]|uniref:hybrid sensor histidine kinase/response regulator transcription factor n=2 Tax=uncultured Duncaniella sp. TaxID=2768039 RepID=UPI00272AE62C|nr:hybrid sensor histidine kinase/response regulator transcription factor [uncultured Duncaniella sp.]